MKKYLLVPAGILFFFTVTNCYAGKTVNLHIAAKEIKYASNLTGVERMSAMQQYVCRLPEAQLIPLMERIGAERFLADVQGKNRIRTHNQAASLPHLPGKMGPTSSHNRRQQMYSAIHTPGHKMRICQDIANYLLNTVH